MKNIGIIGAGYIATRVAKGIHASSNAVFYGIASRDYDKAKAFMEKHGAKKCYGSYEEMCNDDAVDMIYICTPNHLHYDQIKLCLDHHKHVVCEKPMLKNEKEVQELFDYAHQKNCFLMEAHKTCFTPLNQMLFKRLQNKEFGDIISISADYSYDFRTMYTTDSWAMDPNNGGCSYDVGVYPACLCNFLAHSDIKNVTGYPIRIEDSYVDMGMRTLIEYENGIIAQADCNWLFFSENKGNARIVTTKGRIEIPSFWKSNKAVIYMNDTAEKVEVEMESDFTGEVEEAVNCVEKGLLESEVMGCHASKQIMKIIDTVNVYRTK